MTTISYRLSGPRGERGVVLFVALIVLIVMTLSGLALLRQMSAGTSIAGNIAFRENATFVADRGAEVAVAYLGLVTTDRDTDNYANGYVATWADGMDPFASTFWSHKVTLSDDFAQTGNRADVLIQRLCQNTGSPLAPTQRCSDKPEDNPFRSHGNTGSTAALPSTTPFPFYRVTTRVLGPRNTASYTQVLMQ